MIISVSTDMDKIIQIYKALSDKNRLRILKILERKALCVCELSHILGINQSSTSEHLKALKDAGFIKDRKNGYFVDYYLTRDTEDKIIRQELRVIAAALKNNLVVLKDGKKAASIDRNKICKR